LASDLAGATGPTTADARGRLGFDDFATRILYVVTFALGCVATAQIDLWWLLRAGQDLWHTGHVPLTDHYSWTAEDRDWPNHEWLWEAIAYALHHVGGMPLLAIWTGATVTATAWLMRHNSRATGYVVPLVLGIALPLMSVSWTIRPQVTSMLLFAVTMLLLARERYRWIPAVFLLWANLHAQVVMGGVLLGLALLTAVVDAGRSRTPEARRRAVRLALTTAASAALTLATPLGPGLWVYVLDANGRPGQDRIAEWSTAFDSPVGATILWPVLAVAVIFAVRRRDRLSAWSDRVPAIAAVAMAPLAALAIRNIPFFVVAVVPLLMTLLEFRTREPIGLVGRWRAALAGFAALTAAGVVATWVASPPRLAWRPVPSGLATALRACPGPLYNGYDAGAALIWFVPDVKVFVDNRQDPYPASVIDASMGLRPEDYPRTFARFGIGCALVSPGSALVPALRHDGWTPTYQDSASVVLVPPASPRATSATE
jgi:hypothetical protein